MDVFKISIRDLAFITNAAALSDVLNATMYMLINEARGVVGGAFGIIVIQGQKSKA